MGETQAVVLGGWGCVPGFCGNLILQLYTLYTLNTNPKTQAVVEEGKSKRGDGNLCNGIPVLIFSNSQKFDFFLLTIIKHNLDAGCDGGGQE